ncbi:MAG: PorT family protein [Prevotellaceae bacterium]|jgi:hypothetical protein|nr:PorT family protein [Prevotellaceae bacterium]
MQRVIHNGKQLIPLLGGIICFCLVTLISTDIRAQHYVGVKGSQGYNSVSALPDFDKRSLQTFSPGILYRYEHKKYTAIQVEFNYINKGYIRTDTISVTPDVTHRISSVELPLMAQGLIRLGPFRPYITGGVIVGYILDRTEQETGKELQQHVFDEYDKRFEYGLAGGGGLGIAIYKFEIQAECRYHYNFSFLRNPVIPGNRSNSYINSTQLMFSVSLLYRLSK